MKISELDLSNKADFNQELSKTKAKIKELQVLAQKAKTMYEKAIAEYERTETQNAEKFDEQPTEAFKEWFEHMFKVDFNKTQFVPGFQLNDNTVKKVYKLFIAYASMTYFLKPKTPIQGADTFLQIVKAIDKNLVSQADTVFGRYVRGEEQKNPGTISQDLKLVLQNLSPEQQKQLQALLDKSGGKA